MGDATVIWKNFVPYLPVGGELLISPPKRAKLAGNQGA